MNSPELHALTESILYELTKAFALRPTEHANRWVRLIFGKAARAAAETGLALDRAVAEGGLYGGAHWLLPRFVKSHAARGVENIPPGGALVIVSNHPGNVDSVVISAYISRRDYKIIIGDIPFFQRLPHINQHAIFAPQPQDAIGRARVVRQAIHHLQGGGALLIFPRGGIEADPDFMPNADDEFQYWSRSLEIFLRHVPGLNILTAITSGVIAPRAFHHPITWFRRRRPDKQRLAFLYQLARQMLSGKELFGLTPRVTFGELIGGNNHSGMLARIEHAARRTLQFHMTWRHVPERLGV